MKKRRLKKGIKFILTILLVIIISYISITIYQKYSENNFKIEVPENQEIKRLKELNYKDEEIDFIIKEISKENLNYLIKNKIDHTIAYSIIKETYYIDEYLEKYIKYLENNQDLSFKEIITRINCHLDVEFYTNTEPTNTKLGKYVILNKHYYADGSYKGENLVDIDGSYNLYGTSFKLSKECYEAFLKMYKDAKALGYGFKINSAYRSFESQKSIYQGWVNQDGQELADTYSARAGYSEHQTGFAFDVRDYPFTNDDYSKTKSFTWVSQNAYKYGFIIRFPKGKEYITGYQYEPWHYRYCGLECAEYINKHDITYEEYYEYFIRYNNPRNLK